MAPARRGRPGPGRAARGGPVAAPWLLWAEFRNILVARERRGRLPAGIVEQAVEELGIALDTAPSGPGVVDLARRHGLPSTTRR